MAWKLDFKIQCSLVETHCYYLTLCVLGLSGNGAMLSLLDTTALLVLSNVNTRLEIIQRDADDKLCLLL
jgi:hypothetical protein